MSAANGRQEIPPSVIEPHSPANERERQAALERYEILDSLPERAYDDITALMAEVCDAPVALVGLIDGERNWLKSRHGVPMSESPRSISFCGHAIVSGRELFDVEDARTDPRFADNPLVLEHGIASYAGAPLVDADGFALGTLCVFDVRPRVFTGGQQRALKNMARQVMYLLEHHLRERRLERARDELAARNEDLRHFAGAVSHDIAGPVTNLAAFLALLEDESTDEELSRVLHRLHRSSLSLREYIDGLSAHYLADGLAEGGATRFELDELFDSLDLLTVRDEATTLAFERTGALIRTHRAALQQVLLNLVSNAVKHGATTGHARVEIRFADTPRDYRFKVVDNGLGIAAQDHGRIFELFETGGADGGKVPTGTGIGLATVRRLLHRLGGSISLDSAPGRGTTFTIVLPKPDAGLPDETA